MKKRKSLMTVMVIAIAIGCTHHPKKNETKSVSPAHSQESSQRSKQSIAEYDLFPGLFVLMLINKI